MYEPSADYLVAEISQSALRHNLQQVRARIPATTRVCAVIKADCYGHGWDACLPVLVEGADWFAVSSPFEALALRERGVRQPVLAFLPPCGDGEEGVALCRAMMRAGITITVSSLESLALVRHACGGMEAEAQVHLKVDTGMTRAGVGVEQAPTLVEQIRATPGMRLTGIYTHMACADADDLTSARAQLARLLALVEQIGGREGLTLHAANSAATIALPEAHLDMVRPGLMLYGYQPQLTPNRALALQPCLRLRARALQVREAPAGSQIGYGQTYTAPQASRLALISIGYADGYRRALSNRAQVGVEGALAPVRGRISMDQTIVEIGAESRLKVGDWVEVLSPRPSDPHSVEQTATMLETISYEVTTTLGPRVRRKAVEQFV